MKATARWLIVVTGIFSWLALSNHCVVTALTEKTQSKQSGCPFHSKPSKQQPRSTECCKILRAIPTTPTKELTPAIIDLLPLNGPLHQLATLEPPQLSFAPATFDTGPPGKTCFVELNRSVRAHAPPFRA